MTKVRRLLHNSKLPVRVDSTLPPCWSVRVGHFALGGNVLDIAKRAPPPPTKRPYRQKGSTVGICQLCGAEYLMSKDRITCSANCFSTLRARRKLAWLLSEVVDQHQANRAK